MDYTDDEDCAQMVGRVLRPLPWTFHDRGIHTLCGPAECETPGLIPPQDYTDDDDDYGFYTQAELYRWALHDNGVHTMCLEAECETPDTVERLHSHDHDGPLACGCDEFFTH